MALTRKFLTALGIDGDKIDEIINAHSETVEALKAERDEAKAELDGAKTSKEKLQEMETELEKLREEAKKKDPFEKKYTELEAQHEALKAEYEKYKADIEAKSETDKKRNAYKELLKEAGVSEKRFDAILKVADLSQFEFNEDGTVKNADTHKENIKTEWADFIGQQGQQGASTETPPANTGGTMTKEDIMNIKDTGKRQLAMAEHHELFGF